ncbi:MAG: GtrA family protein [Catalinimonas sp.]
MPSTPLRSSFTQVVFFVIAGGICALLEFSLLIAMVEVLHVDPLVANPFAFTAAVLLNYVISRRWVFETGRYSKRRELVYFLSVSLMAFAVNQGIFWLLVEGVLSIDYRISKIMAIGGASVFNFFAKKLLVFKG